MQTYFLEASTAGRNLYKRIGFQSLITNHNYEQSAPHSPHFTHGAARQSLDASHLKSLLLSNRSSMIAFRSSREECFIIVLQQNTFNGYFHIMNIMILQIFILLHTKNKKKRKQCSKKDLVAFNFN